MGRLAVPQGARVQRFPARLEGFIPFVPGSEQSLEFLHSEYLESIFLEPTITVTSGGTAPTPSAQGAYAPLGRVILRESGARERVNIPGFYLDQYRRVRLENYKSNTTADPVTPNATTKWGDALRIDLTIDPLSPRGLIYLGDTSLNVELAIQCPTIAQVFNGADHGATIAGGWNVWKRTINAPRPDLPDPRSTRMLDAISFERKLRVHSTTALDTSEKSIDLPRSQDYLRILLFFYTGNVANGSAVYADGLYRSLRLRVNDEVDLVPNWTEGVVKAMQGQDYDAALTPGLAVIDFMSLWNSREDVLATDAGLASELKLYVDPVDPTAGARVDVVLETVVDAQAATPWLARAAALKGRAA